MTNSSSNGESEPFILIKSVVTSSPNAESKLFVIKDRKDELLETNKGKRLQILSRKYKDSRSILRSWNGSNCYVDIDGAGRQKVSSIQNIRIFPSNYKKKTIFLVTRNISWCGA